MPLPADYLERVYAGVLGKIIGVYLGRPFEGWTYERILAELGDITGYVHERFNQPLVVTDDDISGTFTFLRALPDRNNTPDLTPAQIGESWLNYIIEQRTILWWGGLGNSTEHTAFLRLKDGIPAPESGSIALNSQVVAEQIGAQIFIDGWAMIAPGDPERAADFARRAGSVSHDGEAIYGAQVLAAMEAQAFVESNIDELLDTGLSVIPADSTIASLIGDIRAWHAQEPDWRVARDLIAGRYGYDTYGGNCHMVPNHALIILGLLYGQGNFRESMTIVNTSGWDTDCNSGNLACLLGIRNGLAAFDEGIDWRGPVADRMYLATAEGGRAVTDAVTETVHVVNIGRSLAGEPPVSFKGGARFHFDLPGSVQGFQVEQGDGSVANVVGHSQLGHRSLAVELTKPEAGPLRVSTPTFIPPEAKQMGYTLLASPSIYPGQTLRISLLTDAENRASLTVRPILTHYDSADELATICGPKEELAKGIRHEIVWQIPDMQGFPIARVGIQVESTTSSPGRVYLDTVHWDGAPSTRLDRTPGSGSMWQRAWVDGLDQFEFWGQEPYRLVQNHGRGMATQGTHEWTDYQVSTSMSAHLARAYGVAVRAGGMRRYYALLLGDDGYVRLIKSRDGETVLATAKFQRESGQSYALALDVRENRLVGSVDGKIVCEVTDVDDPLMTGSAGLVCEEGCARCDAVTITPSAL